MPTITSRLKDGAVYSGDNGRLLCSRLRCAGHTATATGHDLSGQRLFRVSVADLADWPADLGDLRCECGAVTLSRLAGPDGWPLAR